MAEPAPALPNLDVFAATLCELAEHDRGLLVVTSDSRGSGRLAPFAARFPRQLVEVGIAEQALVGVACGLAACGKRVYAVSPASFLTARALEQVKNDAAYSDNPVTLVGISAGVSYGALGSTHHAVHDLAALLAVHNISLAAPADNAEARGAVLAAYRHPHPVYLRFGKKPLPANLAPGQVFTPGGLRRMTAPCARCAIVLFACGETAWEAAQAAGRLAARGVACEAWSVPWLRPLDEAALLEAAGRAGAVLTAEEHSVNGGLGSLVASLLMRSRLYRPLDIAGLPDEHTVTGSQAELFAHYGLDAAGLERRALALLGMNP